MLTNQSEREILDKALRLIGWPVSNLSSKCCANASLVTCSIFDRLLLLCQQLHSNGEFKVLIQTDFYYLAGCLLKSAAELESEVGKIQ